MALLAVQLVIFMLFYIWFGNLYFYFIFWCLPIATIGKLCSSTRLLCEHSSAEKGWVFRSIDGPRWKTWLFGAFDFNYHAEHHLAPSIPFANLQELHKRNRWAIENNPNYQPLEGRVEFYSGGYLGLLGKWFRELPWQA